MSTKRAIIDLINKGYDINKICKKLGLKSKSSVYRVMKGTSLNASKHKALKLRNIYDALEVGRSQTEIAKSFGVTQPYVSKLLKNIKWVEVDKISTLSSLGVVKQKEGYIPNLLEEKGYKYMRFLDSYGVKRYIHELVAEHFVRNPSNFKKVGHKDGDKTNNRAYNLCWIA